MTRRNPTETSGEKWAWLAVLLVAASVCKGGSKSSASSSQASASSGEKAAVNPADPAATDERLRTSGIVTARKACDLVTPGDAEEAVVRPTAST